MRSYSTTIVCLFIYFSSWGQNLVSNSSFECKDCCPQSLAGATIPCLEWWDKPLNGGGSPDYWACSDSIGSNYGTPENYFGHQEARTGTAYGGMYVYTNFPNGREYLQVPLTQPLEAGKCYRVQFFVSLSEKKGIYAIDKMGAHLSVGRVEQQGWSPIDRVPQVENAAGRVLADYENWMEVSGTFQADGGEDYLTLGNFNEDDQTHTFLVQTSGWTGSSYYWVDDVSVEACEDTLAGFENICEGGQIELSPSGGTSFLWNTGDQTPSITANPSQDQQYTVWVNDSNFCISYTDSFYVAVDHNVQQINLGNDTGICEGTALELQIADGAAAQISWSTGSKDESIAVNDSGHYWVAVVDSMGCISRDTIFVSIFPNPDLSLGNDTSICSGSSLWLEGLQQPGGDYLWSTGSNTSSIEVTSSGNYWVAYTDLNGCSDTDDVVIDLLPPVQTKLTTDKEKICPGEQVMLTVVTSGGSGTHVHNWMPGSITADSLAVTPSSSLWYSVTAQDSLGCFALPDSVYIEVLEEQFEPLEVGLSGNICSGDSAVLLGQYNGDLAAVEISWNNTELQGGLGPFLVSPEDDEIYHLTLTDQCDRSVTDSAVLMVHAFPEVKLPQEIIHDCAGTPLLFRDSSGYSVGELYHWSFGDGQYANEPEVYHSYEDAGIYEVELQVLSGHGCATYANSFVEVTQPRPEPDLSVSKNRVRTNSPEVSFSTAMHCESYFWDFGDEAYATTPAAVHAFSDTGNYIVTLTVVSLAGCSGQSETLIEVLPHIDVKIPNAFTPNQEGSNGGTYDPNALDNDVFYPIVDFVDDYEMIIFNKWGEEIYRSTNIGVGWDGYYQGKLATQDVYAYRMKFRFSDDSEVTRVGDVLLIR